MIPVIHDTALRTLTRLSLFGDGDVTVDGKPITRFPGRRLVAVHGSMFRRFTCVDGCFVCCTMSHTLDWLPVELDRSKAHHGVSTTPRHLIVNGLQFDINTHEKTGMCPFLVGNREKGMGCAFWPDSPIECWAALNMRVMETAKEVSITKQPMARAWRYKPEPQCKIENAPLSEMDLETNLSIFNRYIEWADYFKISAAVDRLHKITNVFRLILAGHVTPSAFFVP